jgi:hypothetical protein
MFVRAMVGSQGGSHSYDWKPEKTSSRDVPATPVESSTIYRAIALASPWVLIEDLNG